MKVVLLRQAVCWDYYLYNIYTITCKCGFVHNLNNHYCNNSYNKTAVFKINLI